MPKKPSARISNITDEQNKTESNNVEPVIQNQVPDDKDDNEKDEQNDDIPDQDNEGEDEDLDVDISNESITDNEIEDDDNENDNGVEEIEIKVEEEEAEAEDGDECLYKFKKIIDDDDDIEDDEAMFSDDDKDIVKEIKTTFRSSKPFLTKYEYVRLISDRAKQLSLAAKPMILDTDGMTPTQIAEYEISYAIKNKQRIFPLRLEREMPDGSIEEWYVDELYYDFK